MVYFCRFYRCFYFICGIIWIVDRFMLLVYIYFVIKNQSVWMLTSCTKYQVFVSLCFSSINGITFINPTIVEFHHPLLDHVCCINCCMIKTSKLFHILNFFQN